MAVSRKRGKSQQLDYYDHTGKRIRRSLGRVDRATALAVVTRKNLELLGNPTGALVVETVEEFSKKYLKWYAVQYPSSFDRINRIFTNHILPRFGGKPLNTLTVYETTQWLSERVSGATEPLANAKLKAVVTPESANKELKAFKAMCNRAVDWEVISTNPIKKVMPLVERSDKPPVFYVPAQLKKLYKASSRRNRAMWKLIANLGLRRQEALNLLRTSRTPKQVTILSTNESPTKGSESRVVPLNTEAKLAWEELESEIGDSEYVFPRMTGSSMSRALKKDAKRAGLPGSMHSLRHSFGANLTMNRVPLRAVQILMGHSSIETTEIYASLSKDYLAGLTSKIAL